jgi:flavorubredoxin
MQPELLPTQPYAVVSDTFLIPTLAVDPMSGAAVGAHSLVIRGSEPVIVDTGVPLVRETWTEHVTSVVDLEDVRWIYISHDDPDHLGNLQWMLDRCPNATMLANFGIVERLSGDMDLPLERMRVMNAGDSLLVGDRTITSVVPPLFDSPTTRGLFDSKNRLYWAVDSFASLLPGAVYEADDVPNELFEESFFVMNAVNSPWLAWLDPQKFAAHVADSAVLQSDVVVSAHGPVLRGARIADAFARTIDLAGKATPPPLGQDVLEFIVSSMLAPAS